MYEYSNNSERKLIVRFFSSTGFIATFSMASLAFINNSYLLAFTLVVSSFVYLSAFNIGRGVEKSATVILYNLYALMFYLVLTGGAQGTGPIWIFIVSPVTYSIRGLKRGTFDIVLFLSAIVLGFYCADTFNIYDYNPEQFPIRIILAFIIVASLSGYYEFSREKYSSKLIALSKKNEFLATIDPLTNLPNRRYAMNKLVTFKTELTKNHIPFVILLADVDNFKKINDQFGHDFGDEALIHLAKTFERSIPKDAIASRWGGEEFLIAIPNAAIEDAEEIAEKIHHSLKSSAVKQLSHSVKLTISIGAISAGVERSIDLDIKLADELLYKAKEQGKNRTCSS
ncbi:GGDEF domain-containing protein [Pseudoalteromonas sp. SWN166]|uniref:GGDEF domain-containing protein n=1 Tax=Pseudoalteromonas sp. SWN166 TaxID=2792061 RepID=UPI002F402615